MRCILLLICLNFTILQSYKLNRNRFELRHGRNNNLCLQSTKFNDCFRIGLLFLTVGLFSQSVHSAPATFRDFNDLSRLELGLREIDYLLDHWKEKTTYCNFGEFQRELLLPENKEKLFKAAAETGLLDYDKSKTMNVMCRKDPQIVRAFVGLTPENPLLNKADVLMRRPSTIALVNPDQTDDYIEAVESYTQALAEVDALGYEARTDFASTETSFKGNTDAVYENQQDYLSQSRKSLQKARSALSFIVKCLPPTKS